METLSDAVGVVVPTGGTVALLIWLFVHVLRQSSSDRGDYRTRIVEQRQEHRADIDALAKLHSQQIANLRSEIDELRSEVKELRGEVEAERRARHAAEEDAARLRRQAGLSDERPG